MHSPRGAGLSLGSDALGSSTKLEGRSAESGMKVCIVVLLTLNAIFTGGIFIAVGSMAMQGHKMGPSLQGGLEAVAAARPVIAGLSSFFNISTDTVLLPPSLPDFFAGMLSADFAPVASTFAATSSQLEKTMQSMGPFDSSLSYDEGILFSSYATFFAAINAYAAKFQSWVPPTGVGGGGGDQGPSWFEKLAFGEGFLTWLKNQGDAERLQHLSDACDSFHQQLANMQLGSVGFPQYELDPLTRKLKVGSYVFPINVDIMNHLLADWKIGCAALKTAATEGQGLLGPEERIRIS